MLHYYERPEIVLLSNSKWLINVARYDERRLSPIFSLLNILLKEKSLTDRLIKLTLTFSPLNPSKNKEEILSEFVQQVKGRYRCFKLVVTKLLVIKLSSYQIVGYQIVKLQNY